MFFKKLFVIFSILICLFTQNFLVLAQESNKFPDYSYEYIGNDKWENFNRKIFNFNLFLNKYAIRPVHILWSSLLPEYGIERIQSATNNIEYPIRLVSSLLQRDFETSKKETIRFFTNTIIGLGGLYDPAKKLFHIEQSSENMEQALAGCKMKTGPYIVLPIISSTTLRGVLGRILDMALNPGSYIATPVLAIVKAGLTVNKTSFMQPIIKMVESTYADPYDIAKKIYGLESYIRCANMDRIDLKFSDLHKDNMETVQENSNTKIAKLPAPVLKKAQRPQEQLIQTLVSSEIVTPDILQGGANIDEILKDYSTEDFKLSADMLLFGFNPQNPIVDSMRTALFNLPHINDSMWNDLSVWNRSFANRIKTSSIQITEGKDNYKFRYIMQKDKNSPVAIIYPSIGEGIMSSHSVLLAKLFYDKGYSVVIQGSHFQWEFVKSMPDNYHPGLPKRDALVLKEITSKILSKLEEKYNCEIKNKTFIGTSFGALTTLFVAASEYENNTLGNSKFISICPPVELIYAMKQIDKNTEDWNNSPNDLKQKVAMTAAKVLKLYQTKDELGKTSDINNLPFSEEEGKLITGFIMHQKLSDLIFTMENTSKTTKTDIYQMINNMNYQDYAKKYLLSDADKSVDDLSYESSLTSISDYLMNNNNYKIYHSLNDYLTNTTQLKKLKQYSGSKVILLDNGAHLGFLYRDEFIEDLQKTIDLHQTTPKTNDTSLSIAVPILVP